MKTTTGGYISRLDHLRFFAAFLVFQWHFSYFNKLDYSYVPILWPLSILHQGHTGVAFFMVISGFIFSTLTTGRSVRYREFIRNRVFRIAPLLFVWVTIYFYMWNMDPVKILAAIFFFLNPDAIPGNGWSAIVEFQCYLIFPFLLIFLNRFGLRYLVGLLAFTVLVKLGVWMQAGTVQHMSYSTIVGRVDQFLCGMIAARVIKNHVFEKAKQFLPWICITVALGALSYLYHRFNVMVSSVSGLPEGNSKAALWAFIPVFEGIIYSLFIVGYLSLPIFIPKIVDRTLSKLGEVSYSLYLCHAFILSSLTPRLISYAHISIHNWIPAFFFGNLVVLPICFLMSFTTYYLIEKPFLLFRRSYLEPLNVLSIPQPQHPHPQTDALN